MSAVLLDIDEFRDIYPMFVDNEKFPDKSIEFSFASAELKVNNGDHSIVPENIRKILLYMLTAHILALRTESINGEWYAGVISSASEGSTSIGMSTANVTTRNAWYMRTPFGQEYWEMTAKWRSFNYTSAQSRPSWEGTNGKWWNLRS